MDVSPVMDNPFAVLSFLAAPAILTNASTLLILSTSNRLARASDRARAAHAKIMDMSPDSPHALLERRDFENACLRAKMLVKALSNYYFSAGSFAAGTCLALLGSFAGYFHVQSISLTAQIATTIAAIGGVGGLVLGSAKLVRETRLALNNLGQLHASITQWRATHPATDGTKATTGA